MVTLIDQVPAAVVATSVSLEEPAHNSTLPPTSAAVPVKVSEAALVMPSVVETPVSVLVVSVGAKDGATVVVAAILRLSAADFKALVLPATSVCVTVRAWMPTLISIVGV